MIWLAIALQAGSVPVVALPATRSSDAQACAILNKIAADLAPELPKMVDTITRVDGMSVICGLRAVTWNKFLAVSPSQFREGWQARKQSQFNDVVCKNAAFLPMWHHGWRFTQNLTFQSGERFVMNADCNGS